MTLDEAAALYGLEMASGEALVEGALSALNSGVVSDDLACLAGMTKPAMRDAAPLFEAGLSQLGRKVPTAREAALFLAGMWARRIVSGEVAPVDGALEIAPLWNASSRIKEISPIYGLADDVYEALTAFAQADPDLKNRKQKQLEEINRKIVESAKDLLAAMAAN